LLFNQFDMLELCSLRHANFQSANNWQDVCDPVFARFAERKLGRAYSGLAPPMPTLLFIVRLEDAGFVY
jgi:hypothetical protein